MLSARAEVQVGAERLLDDDAPPACALLEAGLLQVDRDQPERPGRYGEVEQDVAVRLVFGVKLLDDGGQALEGIQVVELARRVIQAGTELVPDGLIEVGTGVELLDVGGHALAELVGRHRVHGTADDGELVRQEAVAGQVEDRRHEQAFRQIAGRPEDDHDARSPAG